MLFRFQSSFFRFASNNERSREKLMLLCILKNYRIFMSSFETSISRKLPLVSLISAIFIIYTNIAWIPWELSFLSKSEYFGFFAFFTYRFLFFLTFIYLLLRYNLGKLQTSLFTKRLWKNPSSVSYLPNSHRRQSRLLRSIFSYSIILKEDRP